MSPRLILYNSACPFLVQDSVATVSAADDVCGLQHILRACSQASQISLLKVEGLCPTIGWQS